MSNLPPTKHPNDLSIHPSLRGMPELADTDPEFLALVDSLSEHGYLRKVLIDEHDQIVDGRHLCRAARALGHKEVPIEIVADDEIESVILATLLARRHYTKGALAYLSLPLLDEAVRQGAIRKKANLKKGKISEVAKIAPEGASRDSIAERIGVSARYVQQAKQVEAYFCQSDARREAWLKVTPGAADAWAGYDLGQRGDWTRFRLDWIAEHAPDPHANPLELEQVIPECLRDRYLPQLFQDQKNLGDICKAAGYALAPKKTTGRPDLSEDYVLMRRFTVERAKSHASHVWQHFERLQPEDQGEAIGHYLNGLGEVPKPVLVRLYSHLSAMRKEGEI